MNDQDAFDEWFAKRDVWPRITYDEVWHAALAYLRSQGDPVAWRVVTREGVTRCILEREPLREQFDLGETFVPLFLAPQPAWRKVDDEIESGVGIRWVSDTGIHGRPTAHDVREYLERRGESAKCGCDKCTAPQPAIPDGWKLVPKEIAAVLQAIIDDFDDGRGYTNLDDELADRARAALVLLAAAPQPAIPDGYRLVPVEPTQEMIGAFADVVVGEAAWQESSDEERAETTAGFVPAYSAMLAAAPEPSK